MKPINLLLLAGFLGAGKTSLLEALLPELTAAGRVAVLLNEFGSIALDAVRLQKFQLPVREICGGSIFCSCKQADLVQQLESIAQQLQPDLLVLEASGMAMPADTSLLLQHSYLRDIYALPQVLTVVDALNYPKLADILPVLDQQVAAADTLVLSKIDFAPPEKSLQRLRKLNPQAPILYRDREKLYGQLQFGSVSSRAGARQLSVRAPEHLSVCNWQGEQLSESGLEQLLQEFREELLRGKGVVNHRRLELVNGLWDWSPEATEQKNALFFVLRGSVNRQFQQKLKELEM